MHVVTKILLVFCAVLSILLAALTMAYAANVGAIRDSYKSMEQEKIAAQAARDDLQSQWAQREAELTRKWEAVNDELTRFQKENSDLQAQRTELRTQLEQARAQADANNSRLVELTGTNNTQADLIKVYRDEVTGLRDSMVKSAKRETELTDRINDLESQREVLEQTSRALQEQLKEAQLALQTAQSGNGVAQASDQPFEYSGPPIFARVSEVMKSPANETLAAISEGSNRNIKPNMILNITRDGKFLAKLIILSVEPNRAIGKVDTLGKDVTIQKDDQVLSTLIR